MLSLSFFDLLLILGPMAFVAAFYVALFALVVAAVRWLWRSASKR